MVVVLSFLGRNLKPVNSTWLGLHHLVIKFRKVGALNAEEFKIATFSDPSPGFKV